MIEFDPEKDEANIAKHGVSLKLAERMNREEAKVVVDSRHDYGEPRWIAFQEIDGRLYAFVFTVRDDAIRAISVRKANDREKRAFDRRRSGGSTS